MTRLAQALAPFVLIALLLAAWEVACRALHVPIYFLPPPSAVARALATDWAGLLRSAWNTLSMALIALVVASLLAQAVALVVALFILHAWLPAGRRSFLQILPGTIFTMVASLISGIVFGQYLARFANNYVTMYAGLASVIIALVFLYFIAAIFVYGGELNAAIIKSRLPHGVSLQAAQSLEPLDSQA